jgi:hypothetical protein
MSMTPQERQVLADLFERIRSAAAAPRDAEAEAFIAEAVRAQPYAPYLLAQTALVQQHALDAAAQRIQALEAKAAQPAQESGFLGNLGRSLFGGGQPAPQPGYDASAYQRAAPPPPTAPAAPAYAPPVGPWGAPPPPSRGGGGFLASAMTTATGVAGGLLAANAIESLLGGGRGGLFGSTGFGGGGLGGGGLGGGETVVNNFYDAPSDAGAVDAAPPDAGLDSGDFQDVSDDDPGQDGGGFDDGGSGGGFDV